MPSSTCVTTESGTVKLDDDAARALEVIELEDGIAHLDVAACSIPCGP